MIGKWLLAGRGPLCFELALSSMQSNFFLFDWMLQLAAMSAIASDICMTLVVWFSFPVDELSNAGDGDLAKPSFDGFGFMLIISSVSDLPPFGVALRLLSMVAVVLLATAWLPSALLDELSSAVVVREGQEPNDFELFICKVGSKRDLQPLLLLLQLEIDEEDGESFLDIGLIASKGGLCPKACFLRGEN